MTGQLQAKTYKVQGFELDGFRDEPAHNIFVSDVKKRLKSGLAKYKYRLSYNQMQYFAEYLTTWYKNTGLLFHKVIVPPQEIQNSRLRLKLIPGTLGDISVRGNDSYSKQQVQKPFYSLLNKSVDKEEIEEALLVLNDSPGLNVFSFFSRGKEKNETRINLKVQKEESFESSFKLDNYGVESTGENRLLTQFAFNNPTGVADQLNIGLMASDESLYGSLSYRMPVWNPFHTLSISISDNEFDLAGDFTSLGVSGTTQVSRVGVDHTLFRGYRINRKLSWYLDQKKSTLEDSTGFSLLDSEETSSGLGINLLMNSKHQRHQRQFYMNVYSGQYDEGFSALDGETFDLWNIVLSTRINLKKPSSYFFSSADLMLHIQGSSDLLPSYEKFSLTGIDGVRAIAPGVLSTDNGQLFRISWHLLNPTWLGNNSFSKKIRLSLFYDQVKGEDTESIVEETASGYGLALNFSIAKNMTGQLVYAASSDINISTFTEEESSHAYAELVYRF